MDRSSIITLVKTNTTTDSIGQLINTETSRDVYCNISSVSRSEFFQAGKEGLNPSYVVTMFEFDYEGEKIVILNNKRYSIYRTYLSKNEQIELYLEEQNGITYGKNN